MKPHCINRDMIASSACEPRFLSVPQVIVPKRPKGGIQPQLSREFPKRFWNRHDINLKINVATKTRWGMQTIVQIRLDPPKHRNEGLDAPAWRTFGGPERRMTGAIRRCVRWARQL